jgi:hypothetical protein
MSILLIKSLSNKELEKKFERYTRDFKWIRGHYSELIKEYPESYVAVLGQMVKSSAKTMKEVVSKIDDAGEDPSIYAIEFITTKPRNLLF